MAKASNNGAARSISTQDFNERMKLMLADKADPRPAQSRRTNARMTRKPPEKATG